MKLTIHQGVALWWLMSSPALFAPVMQNAKRPDAGAVMAWGVAWVAVIILAMPIFLRWAKFRSWYGWTDALSAQQRQALDQRNLTAYYRIAFDDGYASRVLPYLRRIMWSLGILIAVTTLLPTSLGHPAIDGLLGFSAWYPMGVMILVFASCPIGRMCKDWFKGR